MTRSARTLAFLVTLLLAVSAPLGAEEARTLLVRGRVTGPEGWPVVGVTVAASGTRESQALTDGQGHYALYLSLPGLAEVARTPLVVRIAPARAGWRFLRTGGAGTAGLEVDVVGPPARLRVRAPDARFANAVSEAFTARGVSVQFADLDFSGAPTASGTAEPAVEMLAETITPVSGVKVVARPSTPSESPHAPARPESASARGAPPTPPPGTVAKPGAAPAPRAETAAAAPPRAESTPGTARAARAHDDSSAAAGIAQATERRRARARTDSLLAADQAHSRAAARARRDSLARVAAAAAHARRDSLAAAHRHPAPVVVVRPAPAAAPDAVGPAPAAPARTERVPVPAASGSDSCACVVKGTVEVRSERRIPEWLRITVWLDQPAASRDSVELFMGSPRPFSMRAPCGTHRLGLRVEPRLQRFTVGPPEALEPFVCEPDHPTQWRLVLAVK